MRQQLTGDYNQRKLGRLLQTIQMLSSANGCTVEDLAEVLDISERSVYRYLNMFDICGFQISKERNHFKISNITIKTTTP
jgi:predicted DNA-binding transcriptional regulator YafY